MTFQARKIRQRRKPDPVAVGKPLTPSAAIRIWYKRELMSVVNPMLADYRAQITAAFEHPEIERFYAQDAAANDYWQKVMKALRKKWVDIFKGFAEKTAPDFVEKADTHAKSTTWFSLTTAGVEQPRQVYNENISNTLNAAVAFNHTLITKIPEDVHEKIYSAIMLSVTSPNPEEQGSSGIENTLRSVLKETGKKAEDRIDLITRDQTSKVNSSLCTERMKQAGVTHFKWLHSSIDEPGHFRITHRDKDGVIFRIDDPELWTGPKGDQGPPGWAINCRCRASPVIGAPGDDDDDE